MKKQKAYRDSSTRNAFLLFIICLLCCRICRIKISCPSQRSNWFLSKRSLKDVICFVLSIHNVDNRTIAVFIYPFCISNTCTVFAESEVISQLSNNVPLPDLVAGIHASVAKRVAALVFRTGLVKDVAMSGGVALNSGVVRALSRELKSEILVHEDCQLAGAIGAAILAYREAKRVS